MLYPSRSIRPNMRLSSGVFSGSGHSPQLTRMFSRISFDRASHSLRDSIRGKVRGVFRSLNATARWSTAGNGWARRAQSNPDRKTTPAREEIGPKRMCVPQNYQSDSRPTRPALRGRRTPSHLPTRYPVSPIGAQRNGPSSFPLPRKREWRIPQCEPNRKIGSHVSAGGPWAPGCAKKNGRPKIVTIVTSFGTPFGRQVRIRMRGKTCFNITRTDVVTGPATPGCCTRRAFRVRPKLHLRVGGFRNVPGDPLETGLGQG